MHRHPKRLFGDRRGELGAASGAQKRCIPRQGGVAMCYIGPAIGKTGRLLLSIGTKKETDMKRRLT